MVESWICDPTSFWSLFHSSRLDSYMKIKGRFKKKVILQFAQWLCLYNRHNSLLRMYIFCDLCVCYYSNIEVKRSFLDIYCVNCLGKLYKFSIK